MLLLCGFNVFINMCPLPLLCLCLAAQEHHEGRYRQQQHSQHLPSQESCGAAEDGGLHGQDKGTGPLFLPVTVGKAWHVQDVDYVQ